MTAQRQRHVFFLRKEFYQEYTNDLEVALSLRDSTKHLGVGLCTSRIMSLTMVSDFHVVIPLFKTCTTSVNSNGRLESEL